jgi:2-polyprenyl-6-methoxyphenol hydroxylase-like FAD-dependent oxidoreductase
MLPYVAQGAAQAMEDAMVLSVILRAIRDKSQVNAALALYEVRATSSTSFHA